jgi:hypothetical protein
VKAIGVCVTVLWLGIFVITLVAVLAPLVLVALICADATAGARQLWRAVRPSPPSPTHHPSGEAR